MKILFIFSNYHLSHITAQPGIALKLAKKSSDKNNQVWILANTDKKITKRDGKIKLVLFKGLGDLKTYILNILTIIKTIYSIKPDVIHIHGHLLFIMISAINTLFQRPITFFLSETIQIMTPFQKSIFRVAIHFVKYIFVTSELIKKELLAMGLESKKITVSRIGIDDRFYKKPRKVKENFDILFFGDSKNERGFDIVCKLAKKLLTYKFLILLRWSEDDKINDLKKLPNVQILQHPYKKSLETYINQSKIILLPFRFMGVRPPVSILEAMMLGKCVYTSTMGGNDEVIQDNLDGFLDSFKNTEKTILRIKKILTNKQTRQKIGEHARSKMLSMYNKNEYSKILSTINKVKYSR